MAIVDTGLRRFTNGAAHILVTNPEFIFSDSAQLDAFSRLRVSSPFGIFDNKQIHTRNAGDWEERLFGCVIVHGTVTGAGFSVGETITGATSGEKGTVTAVGSGNITYSTKNGNDFVIGETITGGTSGSTAAITTYDTGANIVYNFDRSSTYLKIGTATGCRAIRQTTRYLPYVPGKSHHIMYTGVFGAGKANVRQYILYGDDRDALGFCLDGTSLSVLLRTSTSGSIVDTLVSQSQWNVDKLDGTGASGIALDVTKIQIFLLDFQWLGSGRIRFSFDIDGVIVVAHEISNANRIGTAFMKTPTLPIRYEIINTGVASSATTLEQVCVSVASEGGYALPGQEFSVGHGVTRIAVTTRRPILAVRMSAAFPAGKPNRRTLRFLDWSVSAKTNDCYFELMHIHDPNTITATWIADPLSGTEHSVDISAVSGMMAHLVQIANVSAGSGQTSGGATANSEFVSNHSFISQNFESDNSQMLVIFATSESGTSNVLGHLSFIVVE